METKPTVTIDDFIKLDLRVGLVEEATIVEKSEKLLRLKVRFDNSVALDPAVLDVKETDGRNQEITPGDTRIIFAGVKLWYAPEDLVGKKFAFIVNLEPRKMMGEESQGMMLAAGVERAWLWPVPDEVPVGAVVR